MKIVITGSNGFVGSNLRRFLSPEFTVIPVDIGGEWNNPANKLYSWDDLFQLPRSNTIIHLAGKAHDTANRALAEEYFEINYGLTRKIFDYFIQSEAEKFIFFSSVKAVADSLHTAVLREDSEPDPKTPYGQSKLAAENYILSLKVPDSRKVYILRPCMIHGPGNKGNLNLLYRMIRYGIPYPLGAFQNLRSYTSVDNLKFVIRELLEKDIPSGTYNMADDDPVSTNEIVEMMADSLKRRSRIYKIPESVVRGLAKTGDHVHFPLNSDRLNKLTGSYIVSAARLKAALGIENFPLSARDGLRQTFESFNK
jgi:nucleoside-diphosphate-sugar epimerase